MPDIQNGVTFFANKCRPFYNVILYNWIQWGAATPKTPFQMTQRESLEWWQINRDQESISTKARRRAWDQSLQKLLQVADYFYAITEDTMGNFYEQYLRGLMGLYLFTKKFPQYSKDHVPDVCLDNPEMLKEIRDRMLSCWNPGQKVPNMQAIGEELYKLNTYPELADFFLQNAPMMQPTYRGRGIMAGVPERMKRQIVEMHMGGSGLLEYLRDLAENAVEQNFLKCKSLDHFTAGNQFFPIPNQNKTTEWGEAFPDKPEFSESPSFVEFGLRAHPSQLQMVQHIRVGDQEFHPGYAILRADFDGPKNKKFRLLRQQFVQLLIMDNTLDAITEEFWRYYTKQKRNLAEHRSFYNREKVQQVIFSDQIRDCKMHPENWSMFNVLCANAQRIEEGDEEPVTGGVEEEYAPEFFVDGGFGPAEPRGITVDSPYIIPVAIVAVLAFVIYNR